MNCIPSEIVHCIGFFSFPTHREEHAPKSPATFGICNSKRVYSPISLQVLHTHHGATRVLSKQGLHILPQRRSNTGGSIKEPSAVGISGGNYGARHPMKLDRKLARYKIMKRSKELKNWKQKCFFSCHHSASSQGSKGGNKSSKGELHSRYNEDMPCKQSQSSDWWVIF